MKKGITIEDLCKQKPGSFKESLKEKEAYLKAIEIRRKKRVSSHQTAQEMSWAA